MHIVVDDLDNLLVSPAMHANEEDISDVFLYLRKNAPIHWTEPDNFRPFWTLTRYADIQEVSRTNDVFINSRRLNLLSRDQEALAKRMTGKYHRMYRTIAHMDNPDHREYRRVTRDWFMGKSVKALDGEVTRIANEFIDRMAAHNGEAFDFASEVGNLYPLRVIMSILGVPEGDELLMLRLTQEFFGIEDPDLKPVSGEDEAYFGSLPRIFEYFTAMAGDRRATPRDDLATVIATGQVYNNPIGDLETASYYSVIATAGHDTTAATMTGGLLALLEHPDQFSKLKSDRSLLPKAVEEMFRWVSPVKHFLRTANDDYQLGDTLISKGDGVAMFYPSANRDEDVFVDPYEFNIRRDANRHLAFGFGGHLCLGILLARLEMNVFFRELLKRLEHIQLDGPADRIHANLVGGFKSLPVRCQIS
jgi:cytochrome P450